MRDETPPPPPMTCADRLNNLIASMVNSQYPDGVANWQVFMLAGGMGPYLLKVENSAWDDPMLRIVFTEDDSYIDLTPDE